MLASLQYVAPFIIYEKRKTAMWAIRVCFYKITYCSRIARKHAVVQKTEELCQHQFMQCRNAATHTAAGAGTGASARGRWRCVGHDLSCSYDISKYRNRKQTRGRWNMEHGTRNMEYGTRNTERGTRNLDYIHTSLSLIRHWLVLTDTRTAENGND